MQHRKICKTNNSGDPEGSGSGQTRGVICLHDVSVFEFESLLTFFYER